MNDDRGIALADQEECRGQHIFCEKLCAFDSFRTKGWEVEERRLTFFTHPPFFSDPTRKSNAAWVSEKNGWGTRLNAENLPSPPSQGKNILLTFPFIEPRPIRQAETL